jgi:histidine triad (HIT) family protein
MADTCLFCRIVRGEIPAAVVAEGDDWLAFRDINPQAPTHVLVIPRRHVASLGAAGSADAALLGTLLLAAAQVAGDAGIETSGYRTVINTNADAGQTVFHVHAHVLGGRRMAWPPG